MNKNLNEILNGTGEASSEAISLNKLYRKYLDLTQKTDKDISFVNFIKEQRALYEKKDREKTFLQWLTGKVNALDTGKFALNQIISLFSKDVGPEDIPDITPEEEKKGIKILGMSPILFGGVLIGITLITIFIIQIAKPKAK